MDGRSIDELVKENEQLKVEIEQLTCRLSLLERHKNFSHVGIQTEEDYSNTSQNHSNAPLSHQTQNQNDWINSNGEMSIADMVRSAAEQTMTEQNLPGYVYTQSGHFYNAESGYYYDLHSKLFYHPSTQQYYKYDQLTHQYVVYTGEQEILTVPVQQAEERSSIFSAPYYERMANKYSIILNVENGTAVSDLDVNAFEVIVDLVDEVSCDSRRGRAKRNKRPYAQIVQQNKVADGLEIVEEIIDLTEGASCSETSISDDESHFPEYMKEMRLAEKQSKKFPPCIRLMENPGGILHIVTITGAVIGREGDVILRDENCSRQHAEISYDHSQRVYSITDLSSNGTKLNGQTLQRKEGHRITHEDLISICSTTLNVHIHTGTNTCLGCEPGLNQPSTSTSTSTSTSYSKPMSREKQRKKKMRDLKKSYGLDFNAPLPIIGNDRALVRRKEVGSDHHSHSVNRAEESSMPVPLPVYHQPKSTNNVTTESASVDTALSTTNKGFKMLEKMGWKEGTSLGKSNEGRIEPITAVLRLGRSGLGTGQQTSLDNGASANKIAKNYDRATKIKERYNRACAAPIFQDDSDDLEIIQEKPAKRSHKA